MILLRNKMGTLANGQEIAVKRLSKSSGQGALEFKNEVVLLAKLQHKHLVWLLGFCLEGKEKIFVYEYVPNKSLDYFLFEIAGNSVSSAQGRDHLPGPPRRYLTQPHRHTLPHAATQAYATSRRHKGARYNNTHVATKAIRYRGSIPRSIAEESSRRSTDTKNPQFISQTLAMVDLDGGGDEDDDEHDDDDENLLDFARTFGHQGVGIGSQPKHETYPEMRGQLDWSRRYKMIVGTARGILYLHEDSRLRIIHRDLKASNSLLDSEMNAKVSNFGLAKLFEIFKLAVVGCSGYMSPEYTMHGKFSMKFDTFSFGVFVLEIISGKRNSRFYRPEHAVDLICHVSSKPNVILLSSMIEE
ncbi:hypothetical protein LguiA_012667 [Lonicera macranthoides]